MSEEIESVMKAQIDTMNDQIEKLKELVVDTEEHTVRLKHMIANDLMDALIQRFQANEAKIGQLHENIQSIHQDVKEQLIEVKRAAERHESDRALEEAIKKLLNEKEIKVDSEPLYKLRV